MLLTCAAYRHQTRRPGVGKLIMCIEVHHSHRSFVVIFFNKAGHALQASLCYAKKISTSNIIKSDQIPFLFFVGFIKYSMECSCSHFHGAALNVAQAQGLASVSR